MISRATEVPRPAPQVQARALPRAARQEERRGDPSEVLHFTEEALKAKLSYHFTKLPDASRTEIINMINSYVREAVLPPVVERITKRQILLEKRVIAMEHLLAQILETLGNEPAGANR